MRRELWNKCAVCGRIVPYDDLASGAATNTLVTPESLTTRERFEVLCRLHAEKPPARGGGE